MASKKSLKINNEKARTLVVSIVLLVIGILFCCSLSMGLKALSIVIGVSLIVLGAVLLVTSYMATKGLIAGAAIGGAALLAIGIWFIVDNLASMILVYIPFFLIVVGCIFIVDAILAIAVRKEGVVAFVVEVLIGAIALTLGCCLRYVDGFAEYTALIVGIVIILYSVYSIIKIFMKK